VKAVILCGGKGSRIQSVETGFLPKPLVTIGDSPMIHHILNWYSSQGVDEFILGLGDRSQEIIEAPGWSRWNVTFLDTGSSDTVYSAGRLKRIYDAGHIRSKFFLSYCDILSDINLSTLAKINDKWNSSITLALANPKLSFGLAQFKIGHQDADGVIEHFSQKPTPGNMWANEGIYVVNPQVIECIDGDDAEFDVATVPYFTEQGRVSAYKHRGFWLPVNTISDWFYANEMWNQGKLDWLKRNRLELV
jgi:glucose-1-phosphate cytidylyltransferase